VAIRLAKDGYYGGDPQAILNAPVSIIQSLIDYQRFTSHYEDEYLALNKVKK